MMSRSLTSLAAKSNRVKAKPLLLPKKTCRSILLVITKQCGIFKPELTKRLSELSVDDSTSARVRSILTELLPNGEFTIDDVAKKLGYSKQTLQRKLSSENTTFQKQLNSTREVLALNYLQNTDMTTSDIAYLLGYQEFNSFLRAFSIWKGMSISEYREKMNK